MVNIHTRKRHLSVQRAAGDRMATLSKTQPRGFSLGSGVIVAAQGYILTNNHGVVGADEIAVMLPGGKVAEARVIGTDPETDLAVLHVASLNLQPIVFADPAPVQVGDIVLAVEIPSASARQ